MIKNQRGFVQWSKDSFALQSTNSLTLLTCRQNTINLWSCQQNQRSKSLTLVSFHLLSRSIFLAVNQRQNYPRRVFDLMSRKKWIFYPLIHKHLTTTKRPHDRVLEFFQEHLIVCLPWVCYSRQMHLLNCV